VIGLFTVPFSPSTEFVNETVPVTRSIVTPVHAYGNGSYSESLGVTFYLATGQVYGSRHQDCTGRGAIQLNLGHGSGGNVDDIGRDAAAVICHKGELDRRVDDDGYGCTVSSSRPGTLSTVLSLLIAVVSDAFAHAVWLRPDHESITVAIDGNLGHTGTLPGSARRAATKIRQSDHRFLQRYR
jgi:hypothetical protein